jgi:MFS family permease
MHTITDARRLVAAERDFRVLLGSQFLGQAADGIAQAAFYAALVLEDPLDGGTPAQILGLFALTLLPYSVLAPFLGVFVDRWSRRSLLVVTNLARAVLLLTLPLWSRVLPGDAELFVGILALLGLGRLFLTTKGAALPAVVHEHDLLEANSISGGGGMLSALFGGVIGLALVAGLSADSVFFFAGIVYAGAGWVARLISAPLSHKHEHAPRLTQAVGVIAHELAEGIREIWRRVSVRLPLISIFLLRTVGMFIAVAAILLIKREFPDRADEFGRLSLSGLALGTAGVGAFLAAISAPFLGHRFNKAQLIIVGYAISGIGVIALGGFQHVAAILALTLVGGYGTFVSKVATDAQVQEVLPDELRGRAFALYDILYNLASVAAGAVMVAASDVSLRTTLVWTGLVTVSLALVFGVLMARAGMFGAGEPRAAHVEP